MNRVRLYSTGLYALAVFAIASGDDASAFRERTKSFIEAYCIDCHGPDVQKASMRLDELATDLTDEGAFSRWIRVHDKVAAGEMPPADVGRLPKAEAVRFTTLVGGELHAASLIQQKSQGRVALRRLNGTQYENTIRELVGTKVRVKELLPEEKSVAGFDNVATALDVSGTHLLLFQEAAEKAVRSAVPMHPAIPFHERRTAKDFVERGPNFKQTLDRSCKLDGESLVIYSKLPRYGLCATSHLSGAGRYRIKMSVAAVGGEKKPIPVGFFILENTGRDDPVLFDCRDIPYGDSQVIELEVELGRRQAFVVNLLTQWDIRDFKRPLAEYTGPGLKIDWLEIEGPVGPFPPQSYQRLFAGVPLEARSVAKAERNGGRVPTNVDTRRTPENWLNDPLEPASADPKVDADRLIRSFLPRAFRRPVSDEQAKAFVAQVHQKLDEKYSFYDAMVYGYKAILSSPHFLIFNEPGPDLDDYAIANRLAYFLWSGPPDDELIAAAMRGELSQLETLRLQTERLLQDARVHGFTEDFTGQWLDLRRINATIPDPRLYGDFDGLLLWSMPRESYLVFEEILRHDRSLLEFVQADWSMLNARLAQHYGISNVEGNEFRKVTLPSATHRGGVMTQASVLKVTADGTRTSPVLRGKWVLEKIVGKPPAPPPPNVPAIEPDIRGATTIRQQLEKHREIESCASCHNQIDPPGFALETFDPIGGYREFYRATTGDRRDVLKVAFHTGGRAIYRGPDIEQGGETIDGHKFNGIDEYKQLLLSDKDQLARSLTEKLVVYATGAEIQFADREVVQQIVDKIRSKNYGFRTLIHEVVQSRVFLNK